MGSASARVCLSAHPLWGCLVKSKELLSLQSKLVEQHFAGICSLRAGSHCGRATSRQNKTIFHGAEESNFTGEMWGSERCLYRVQGYGIPGYFGLEGPLRPCSPAPSVSWDTFWAGCSEPCPCSALVFHSTLIQCALITFFPGQRRWLQK